jgi:hypothetical protein
MSRLLRVLAAMSVGATTIGVTLIGLAPRAGAATETTFVARSTNVEFSTASGGTSLTPPSGPLVPGDRIMFRDDIVQGTTVVGWDTGNCVVQFNDNELCTVVATWPGKGDLFASWLERGAASSTPPTTFDGEVTGGSFAYHAAHGMFHAVSPPNGDTTVTITLD